MSSTARGAFEGGEVRVFPLQQGSAWLAAMRPVAKLLWTPVLVQYHLAELK